MAQSWYVARVETHRVERARAALQHRGFATFYPRTRTQRKVGNKIVDSERAYIPGYLFVKFDVEIDPWQTINWTRGVKSLLYAAPEIPARIRGNALEALIEKSDQEFIVEAQADAQLFKIGQTVRVECDPFVAMQGTVCFSDHDRIKVLLPFLGSRRAVTVKAERCSLAA